MDGKLRLGSAWIAVDNISLEPLEAMVAVLMKEPPPKATPDQVRAFVEYVRNRRRVHAPRAA